MYNLNTFYSCKDWINLLQTIKMDRTNDDGQIICAHCGKPIVNKYDCIGHHTIFLTEENVNDVEISLNPELIQLVHHRCHNMIHNKLGYTKREIYLVYGCPLSGKSTYVNTVAEPGDLIVDINNIWSCVSVNSIHSGKLNAVVFKLRDTLLESVKYRVGRWDNCYIVGGYPLISERERLCKELGAREIFIDTSKEVCLERASKSGYPEDYKKYIEDWWRKFKPNIPPVEL